MNNLLIEPKLRLVAWEITRRCNLSCAHCRASAEDIDYSGELSTEECFALIDQIAAVAKPIIILTGGEPLCRPDVFDIGRYAVERGLRVVLGTNGTLIDEDAARKMKQVPVSRVGVSIDFPTAGMQDDFRGRQGAFDEAIAGIGQAQRAGIDIQINSTITKKNAALIGIGARVFAFSFDNNIPGGAFYGTLSGDYQVTCHAGNARVDSAAIEKNSRPRYKALFETTGMTLLDMSLDTLLQFRLIPHSTESHSISQ